MQYATDPYMKDLEQECFELVAKVIELLDKHDLWDENGSYVFNDGYEWNKFRPDDFVTGDFSNE